MTTKELKYAVSRCRNWLMDEGNKLLRYETSSDIAIVLGALTTRLDAEIKSEEIAKEKADRDADAFLRHRNDHLHV